jgi:hypothetical protein
MNEPENADAGRKLVLRGCDMEIVLGPHGYMENGGFVPLDRVEYKPMGSAKLPVHYDPVKNEAYFVLADGKKFDDASPEERMRMIETYGFRVYATAEADRTRRQIDALDKEIAERKLIDAGEFRAKLRAACEAELLPKLREMLDAHVRKAVADLRREMDDCRPPDEPTIIGG